jgi:hypothetical protein
MSTLLVPPPSSTLLHISPPLPPLSNYPFPIAKIFFLLSLIQMTLIHNIMITHHWLISMLFSASAGRYGSPLIFIPPTIWRNACLLPPKPTAPFLVRHHPEIVTSLNVLTAALQHHLSHSINCFLSFGVRHKKQPPDIRRLL